MVKDGIYIECTGCDTNCHLNISDKLASNEFCGDNIKEHMNLWKSCRKGKESDEKAKLNAT